LRAILSLTVGWHFAILGGDAANLTTASGSVGCGFALAASACVGSETIELQTYDLQDSMFYLDLKSNFGVHRVRRFLKWLLSLKRAGSHRHNCTVLISVIGCTIKVGYP